ncbi:hypothetical protein HPB48_011927 [Haemaphysalis longicornis]|uniref:Uncharacterized protein n=1 Tax=Haemaphysalis longicornis TaxID=44386 RepID=A0A9J6FVP0_HAELO|nr:hypothetical protein HPB48_011927 [Haemaphysalis longicornis]
MPEEGRMTSIMAELTPSFPEFLVDIRRAAQWVNHMVTEFVRERSLDCSGIVATDYFLGNGVIDVVIVANIMRGRQKNFRHLRYCVTHTVNNSTWE